MPEGNEDNLKTGFKLSNKTDWKGKLNLLNH